MGHADIQVFPPHQSREEHAVGSADQMPTLSVVIPVFNEAENITTLHARLSGVLKDLVPDYEIVVVDDGSRDESPAILRQCAANDPHVVVVELARNFGHQIAISAGLEDRRMVLYRS